MTVDEPSEFEFRQPLPRPAAMREKEWLHTDNPDRLLAYVNDAKLGGNRLARGRRLRLVGCAAIRAEWDALPDDVLRTAVTTAEEHADRECSADRLRSVRQSVANTFHWLKSPYTDACYQLLEPELRVVVRGYRYAGRAASDAIRDIFGNPFRPVAFDPAWRTSTAVALARRMYGSREFSAMPILADALQDAGCESAEVLGHCRGPGPHVRGCWVVDLVLGKA